MPSRVPDSCLPVMTVVMHVKWPECCLSHYHITNIDTHCQHMYRHIYIVIHILCLQLALGSGRMCSEVKCAACRHVAWSSAHCGLSISVQVVVQHSTSQYTHCTLVSSLSIIQLAEGNLDIIQHTHHDATHRAAAPVLHHWFCTWESSNSQLYSCGPQIVPVARGFSLLTTTPCIHGF